MTSFIIIFSLPACPVLKPKRTISKYERLQRLNVPSKRIHSEKRVSGVTFRRLKKKKNCRCLSKKNNSKTRHESHDDDPIIRRNGTGAHFSFSSFSFTKSHNNKQTPMRKKNELIHISISHQSQCSKLFPINFFFFFKTCCLGRKPFRHEPELNSTWTCPCFSSTLGFIPT